MADTIGQRLEKARLSRHLLLEEVAEATRIRLAYLQALEADDFSALPSPVQARGFLRNYAEYLDLDLDRIVDELRAAQTELADETEVIFEGEQTTPTPVPEITEPEGEEPDAETSAEPFWQTWLRSVKSETGEADESPASQPALEPAPGLETESTPETDASQEVEKEAAEDEAENGVHPKPAITFLEWASSYLPRRQTEDVPALETEAESEPKPKSDPEPVSEAEGEISAEPAETSQEIVNQIAQQLRRRREMLSLTLDEIERHTRMRAQFMEALEKGNFDELPSPVQTRGMLSNYASFLDLDVDALLLRFADALQARHRERYPEKPEGQRKRSTIPENLPRLRSFIAGDLVFGIGMVLLLVAFSVWGISRVIALQSEQETGVQAEATGPSISEALIGTPQETVEVEATLIPAEDTPIPELAEGTVEIPTLAPNVNVQVNIVAVERSYLQVTIDGEVVFDGRTIPGNAYPFEAEQSIEVLAGNGAALRVVYNQRDLGLLGGFGQIARYIYTVDEVVVPTLEVPPTATLTPFISPTPSITPSPTITPTVTRTPTTLPLDVLE
ncbi:MAG: RodZ domain-containing protein [Anaerolineales bacterium]